MQIGIYDVELLIDGLSPFNTNGVSFVSLDIYEAIMNPVPNCVLRMIIPLKWLENRTITDGTLLTIGIKAPKQNIDERYDFRLFNIEKLKLNQNFVTVEISGVIDFYQGYKAGNDINSYGKSSEMFTKIASLGGLQTDIDPTNDAQLWIAGERNIYLFMSDIAAHGWIDETSAMFWCIDRQKRLLYKNLTTLFRNRQENIYTFTQRPPEQKTDKLYFYNNVEGHILSGTNNLQNEGYGGEDYYFDLTSYATKSVAARKVVAESKMINISKVLSQGVITQIYPMDVGNFHKNYYLALKQNKRILSTYSTYLTITTGNLQSFRLAQICNIEFMDSQTRDNKSTTVSNVCMIDAIHTTITTSNITAVLEVTMQGLNNPSKTQETY